jgi:hypothetical protein
MWRANVSTSFAGLPNIQGQPYGKSPPINVGHIFPDRPDEAKPVSITVLMGPAYVPRRELTWRITWDVGEHHYQAPQTGRITTYQIIRRIGLDQVVGVPHLTFWGPITQSVGSLSWDQRRIINIGSLTHEDRQRLEALAYTIAVQPSTPNWNGQDWIISLLRAAEVAHIFTPAQVARAVAAARIAY